VSRGRHIAIFLRSLAGGGGAERVVVTLANALAERGCRVDLVLGRDEGSFLDAVAADVHVVGLGGGSWPATLRFALADPARARRLYTWTPPRVLSCVPALARYLRRARPDAMLTGLNYTNLTALWARQRAAVPTRMVLVEHNTLSMRAAHGPPRLRDLPGKVRRFYPEAAALVAVSDGVAEDLARVLRIPRPRIRTIYNPVVSDELAALAEEPLDHPWFAPGQPPVVLAVGKLRPQKDLPTLLEAFAQLRRRRPARLLVLGEGPLRSRLEARVRALGLEGDVALPGFQRNPFAFMRRSAAFALSSRWEGLPTALIEAMACGCPVVATDCPSGPAEILDKGALGPLVPVGDAPALARALEALLDAPTPPERLRGRAALFSVERSVGQYLEVLGAAAP
jgi:glycosyltransferase involved in cell wall biosynthesis